MRRVLLAIVLCAAAGPSCYVGHNPATSPAARGPRGVDVAIDWRGPARATWAVIGELLTIDDRGVYVVHDRFVALCPFGSPARVRSRSRPRVTLDLQGVDARDARVVALSRYARHPFGLDAEQLEALIEAMGSDSLQVRSEPQ
jgi:hypothetical protein